MVKAAFFIFGASFFFAPDIGAALYLIVIGDLSPLALLA